MIDAEKEKAGALKAGLQAGCVMKIRWGEPDLTESKAAQPRIYGLTDKFINYRY